MLTPVTALEQMIGRTGVRVLFAVEAGSRSWGFPSPDSDYDVRFVYARPLHEYLTIRPFPDFIQHTEDEIDLGGWDVRKALLLMLAGNHAIREWLRSPITYASTEFRELFLELAAQTASSVRLTYSYRSILHKAIRDYLPQDRVKVPLKKYFYAIRSALVMQWLQTHDEQIPPMTLAELLAQCDIEQQMRDEIDDLLARKLVASELGLGPRRPAIDRFIFRHDTKDTLPSTEPHPDALIARYDEVLRRAVGLPAAGHCQP